MATNLSSGKSGKQLIEVLGVKDLQAKISRIVDATVGAEAVEVVRDAGTVVYDQVEANARSVNVPHEVLQDIFLYGKQPQSGRKRDGVSALVGLRKAGRNLNAEGYVTWTPGRQVGQFDKTQHTKTRGRGKSLVLPGTKNKSGGLQKIGENLGTMWEFGTTKMEAKPWFRPGVASSRGAALTKIATGYKGILDRHSK